VTDAAPLRAQVMLEEPVGLLDYAIDPKLAGEVEVGVPVRVPLGRRITGGYVVALTAEPWPQDVPIKALVAVDANKPRLPQDIVALLLFAANYYGVPPGEMLSCALPAMARGGTTKFRLTAQGQQRLALKDPDSPQGALLRLGQAHPKGFTVTALQRLTQLDRAKCTALMRRASRAQDIEHVHQKPSAGRTELVYTRLPPQPGADAEPAFTPRQRRAQTLWQQMPEGTPLTLSAIRTIDPRPASPLKALVERQLVAAHKVPVRLNPFGAPAAGTPGTARPQLTEEQQRALAALLGPLQAGTYAAHLLFGVTGSGKTEVYLQAIEHALNLGKTALVLVPEIALTPQLGERFRSRFGSRVATFHSGLSVAERRDEWLRVASGEAVIGLGARSALFLPLDNLGIIVVDEEHETSFKQDESPRYNARDLAVWRAQQLRATVLLGSATPSLETWHNAASKRYGLIAMPSRVHARPLPEVDVLSLAQSPKVDDGPFTKQLAEAVQATLGRGEQVILFLNRRGFAPYIFCRDCGHSFRCDDCDVSLTLHKRQGMVVCHYCGFTLPAPDTCTGCQGHRIDAFGLGTEQLETDVRALFGEVPLVRLDRDTVRKRSDLEGALGRFRRGEAKMLIGTQMVAKGHDFPNVTLVGVMSADASLNFPDFRAAERTFQLLTQVAGRAGRGTLPGRVMVQAYEPDHYAIAHAKRHDYEGFVAEELSHRQELGYPPYMFLALVRFEGEADSAVHKAAEAQALAWQKSLETLAPDMDLLGPAPAPLARLRGQYRVHLLLKAPSRTLLRRALHLLPKHPGRAHGCSIRRIVDIDPLNML
jgi:primosomal protein N' (replication factor Y)